MKTAKNYPRVGIGMLIFNHQQQVLLGKRIGAHGDSYWAPPGGHLEFDETFEEAACREVWEETGLVMRDPVFLGVTNDIFAQEQKHYVSITLKGVITDDQIVENKEPHKIAAWQWFDLENLPTPLFSPIESFLKRS